MGRSRAPDPAFSNTSLSSPSPGNPRKGWRDDGFVHWVGQLIAIAGGMALVAWFYRPGRAPQRRSSGPLLSRLTRLDDWALGRPTKAETWRPKDKRELARFLLTGQG